MTRLDQSLTALLEALDEPALILDRQVVRIANRPARALLGDGIERRDLRLAIRHPQALAFALAGKAGDLELTGIGDIDRPWRLAVRPIGDGAVLLRLIDRAPAHAAEKLRVDFVANASHELRTPLTAVLGYAESLEDGDLGPELSAKFARTIRTEAKRMLRIIEDLMSLSRIEADRFITPTEKVDMDAVIRSSLERVRATALEGACDIALDLDEDLPAIAGDRPQLTQVVDNLLSNAIRYGCAVTPCKLRITATAEKQWLRIEVADTGPGIPRQHLPFLTRRFYRVDAARSRDSGGTGLGLAIVKHIVERHRGTLAIASIVGEGTTVTLLLPLRG